MVNWELEPSSDIDSSLIGFKLTYSAITNSSSSSNTTRNNNDFAFILDKAQRQFKITNLTPSENTRCTVCVILMRSQGDDYDKYCRDTDLDTSPSSSSPKKPRTKSVNNQTAHLLSSPESTETEQSSSSSSFTGFDTHMISGLMITVLVVLIVCILALIGFIVVYIRRCRLTEKSLKKCMANGSNASSSTSSGAGGLGAYSTSSIGGGVGCNTLSSSSRSKAAYTGALLSHTSTAATSGLPIGLTQKLIEVDVGTGKCFCTLGQNHNWVNLKFVFFEH